MTQPMQYSVNSTAQTLLMWSTSATTSAAGAYTFTLPAGVFTTVVAVHADAVRDTAAPATACFALVRSFSTTQVVVQVFESKTSTVVLGGSAEGLELTSNATTVHLTVIGN